MAHARASHAVALPLLAALVLLVGTGAARGTDDRTVAGAGPSPAVDLWVDPASGDDAAGGGRGGPLRTVQAALDRAAPGTTVHLAAGTYRERPVTRVDGTAEAPITLLGPETGTDPARRHRATLFGTGHVLSVRHSHYVLRGFTIDGQEALERRVPLEEWPTDPNEALAFKRSVRHDVRDGRLVYVDGGPRHRVAGTLVDDMFLTGGGGECVRFREGAHHAAVQDSVVQWCGMHPSSSTGGGEGYHNGEGVYVGTSPKSRSLAMHGHDPVSHVTVRRTTITTFGSECVDVKENAHHALVQDVVCSGNLEPSTGASGSGIELRGWASAVRESRVDAGPGFGVKISADSPRHRSGGNSVTDTTLVSDDAPLKIWSAQPQGAICGDDAPRDPDALPAGWSAPCP